MGEDLGPEMLPILNKQIQILDVRKTNAEKESQKLGRLFSTNLSHAKNCENTKDKVNSLTREISTQMNLKNRQASVNIVSHTP